MPVTVGRYHFGRLLKRDPPIVPPSLLESSINHEGFKLKSIPSSDRSSLLGTGNGKVKVILRIHRSSSCSQGTAVIAAAASETVGNILPPNSPLHAVAPYGDREVFGHSSSRCIAVNQQRNQVTLLDPIPMRRRGSTLIPKTFSFDTVLLQPEYVMELCTAALTDAIRAVLRGQDACVMNFGHRNTGKTFSMIGSDSRSHNIGIIPCAISWLFRCLAQRKEVTGARFSVRLSAVELYGPQETFRDLLAGIESTDDDSCSPSCYLRTSTKEQSAATTTFSSGETLSDGVSAAVQLEKRLLHQCELRAANLEMAAQLLDIALANRFSNPSDGLSHMLFTLHVYQCQVEHNACGVNVSGGRTRLHLMDLGCGRYSHHANGTNVYRATSRNPNGIENVISKRGEQGPGQLPSVNTDPNGTHSIKSLSISGMANVILALLTGQRHLPYRDSNLTYLLREALTGNQMNPCVIAHVDPGNQYYSETLQVVQFASKLSRLRRRRIGPAAANGHICSGSMDGSSSIDSFSDDQSNRSHRRRFHGPRLGRSSFASSISSDLDFTSSSEQSGDTVIYLGRAHRSYSLASRSVLRQLGPRGMADGSVDQRSISSGNCSGGESSHSDVMQGTKLQDTTSSQHSVTTECPVKRMMPRTNATVWPRSFSFRKVKEHLDETWVDGPKAVTHDADALSTSVYENSAIVSSSDLDSPLKNTIKNVPPYGRDQKPKEGCSLITSQPTSLPDMQKTSPIDHLSGHAGSSSTYSERSHLTTSEVVTSPSTWRNVDGSSPVKDKQAAILINTPVKAEPERTARALSDISERTEETENAVEWNTYKSGSSADPRECLISPCSLSESNLLEHMADRIKPWERCAASIYTDAEETILKLRKQILETVLPNEPAHSVDRTQACPIPISTQCNSQTTNGRNRGLSKTTHVTGHKSDYDQLKTLQIAMEETGGEAVSVDNGFTNGCGEQTANMEGLPTGTPKLSVSKHMQIRGNFISNTNVETVDSQLLGASCFTEGCTGVCSSDTRSGKRTIDSFKYGGMPPVSAYQPPSSNSQSLLRVAAWVNSIDDSITYVSNTCTSPQWDLHTEPVNLKRTLPRLPTLTEPAGIPAAISPMNYEYVHTVPHPSDQRTKPEMTELTISPLTQNHRSKTNIHYSSRECWSSINQPPYQTSPGVYNNNPKIQTSPQSMLHKVAIPSSSISSQDNLSAHVIQQDCQQSKWIGLNVSRRMAYSTPQSPVDMPLTMTRPPMAVGSSECLSRASTHERLSSKFPFNLICTTVHHTECKQPECETQSHFVNSAAEQKTERGKMFKGFRFLTLPIFRSFRLRKAKKAEVRRDAKQDNSVNGQVQLYPTVNLPHTIPFQIPCESLTFHSSHHQSNLQENHERHFPPSPSWRSLKSQMPISPTSFSISDTPLAESSPLRPLTPYKISRFPVGQSTLQNTVTNTPFQFSSPTYQKSCMSCRTPAIFSLRSECPSDAQPSCLYPPEAFVASHGLVDSPHISVPNSPSAPLSTISCTGGLFIPACRSGHRSIVGGPASSGYESMHIGTSDLSLSHPGDSASEYSGTVPSSPVGKEYHKSRLQCDGYRVRRTSNALVSRINDSAGSPASYNSQKQTVQTRRKTQSVGTVQ